MVLSSSFGGRVPASLASNSVGLVLGEILPDGGSVAASFSSLRDDPSLGNSLVAIEGDADEGEPMVSLSSGSLALSLSLSTVVSLSLLELGLFVVPVVDGLMLGDRLPDDPGAGAVDDGELLISSSP